MRRSLTPCLVLALLSCLFPAAQAASQPVRLDAGRPSEGTDEDNSRHPARRFPVVENFETNPVNDPDTVATGAAAGRLTWELSDPAWPGDHRGSLTALYDSSLPAGLFGFRLPRTLDETDAFTAAAVFVIDPDGFEADPNGFFQIAWGLWNTHTTGLNRTGDFTSFAGNTFDLLEFDYFPNVSPFFGGPFLAPSLFGESTDVAHPDSFANASFAFGLQVPLPLGVPLLAVIQHEPGLDVAVVSVHRIVRPRRTVPVPGAVTLVDLSALASRHYELDAVGLTLWNDGFGGPTPAVRAKLVFHSLVVERGVVSDVDSLLRPRGW